MDPHQAAEPPPATEAASVAHPASRSGTPPHIDADLIIAQEALEDEPNAARASEDMDDSDDRQVQDSASDVDDGGSDYDPTQLQTEEDSDDDMASCRKKQAKKDETDPVEIEEMHEEWDKWKDIYLDLLSRKETKTLNERQKANLSLSRRNLEDVVKQLPASDPDKKKYAGFLSGNPSSSSSSSSSGPRKRKNDALAPSQTKKARLTTPRQSKPSVTSVSQMPSRQASQQHPQSQINKQLQQLRTQGENAKLEPKRLKSEMKNFENALTVIGENLVTAKDGCWLIQGMKTPLYNYQFDGAGWAVRRERSHPNPDNPRGGILADEMGCGKTITMLAVLMAKPAPKSYRVKANLLLVQSAQMAKQWQSQIRKHCDKRSLSASVYARKSGLNPVALQGEQVIIMTYSEVQRAWARIQGTTRKRSAKAKDGSDEDDGQDFDDTDQEQLLFKSNFHRLLLDECQFIKKHNSATAKAVYQLKSRIQWLISATPAPNSMDEYFPYLKVLGLSNTETLGAFRRYWLHGSARADGRDNLEIGLEKFQLHRTHQTKIAGISIFEDVPNSVSDERTVAMSNEERAIYDAVVAPVEREQRELAARIIKQQVILAEKGIEGVEQDVIRRTKNAEAKILHLHKLTAHPFLLETIMRTKDFPAAQIMDVRGLMKRFRDSELFEQAENVFTKVGMSNFGRSPSMDSQSLITASASHSGDEVMGIDRQISIALGEKAAERKCHLCPGETIPIEAILCECGHAFCKAHFDFMIQFSRMKNPQAPDSCSVCLNHVGTQREVDQTELATARAEFIAAKGSSKGGCGRSTVKGEKRIRKRGDDFNGYQPRGPRSVWLAESDKSHPKVPLMQSSKTRAVLDTIDRWQDDAPQDKIIIFTQWILMGQVLGRCLEDKGINFLYYFGEMSGLERDKNLRTFETDTDVKVIIIGFRCGSQGLDMHYANRVILVDPWWNDDGEAQGFARVKRKIQKKTTFFLRLMAEDSIDMRIAEIKRAKREVTQRLRKEDDPLRRSEIEMEWALKTCKVKLSANIFKTEPDEDPKQDAAAQQGTVQPDAKTYKEETKVADQ